MDHEAVEVLVAPAEDELQGGVKVGDGAVAPDQDATPGAPEVFKFLHPMQLMTFHPQY
jgi:hypothetical protein